PPAGPVLLLLLGQRGLSPVRGRDRVNPGRSDTVLVAASPMTNRERVSAQVDPSHILQVGMGFFGSKTLLSAVELELFTKLGSEGMTGEQLAESLSLHARAIPDFPDALVALGLLDREG